MREVLEGLAAGLAAEKVSAAELAELHDIVVEMENTLAADDLLGHLPLVGRFHQRINEIAGNEFIEQFLSILQAPLIRHQFRVILVPGRKEESLTEHREILAYLTSHDAMGAERAMRQHIAGVRNSLQQANHIPSPQYEAAYLSASNAVRSTPVISRRYAWTLDCSTTVRGAVCPMTKPIMMLDQIVLAETLGFGQCWFAEHHFTDYSLLPSPNLMIASAVQRTSRMRFGNYVNAMSFHHPLRLAAEAAMLDNLARGRFDFGIGKGVRQGELTKLSCTTR